MLYIVIVFQFDKKNAEEKGTTLELPLIVKKRTGVDRRKPIVSEVKESCRSVSKHPATGFKYFRIFY